MSGFRFKQFQIEHDQCAMKVGTDGVILGAYADINQANHILDLGTGTGLIALMLAQRSQKNSLIHALEIDPQAVQQAKQNINNSPWKNKVNLIQKDVIEFCQKCDQKFDLIVANPPYFEQGVACATPSRQAARYMQQSHLDWLEAASSCLAPQGKIQFILPSEAAENLIIQTALYCTKRLEIITKQGKIAQRMVTTFQIEYAQTQVKQLIIYNQQNQYSSDFIELTKDFYLNM